MRKEKIELKVCSLCELRFTGWGKSSWITGKTICDNCNNTIETPVRIEAHKSDFLRAAYAMTEEIREANTPIGDTLIFNITKGIKEIKALQEKQKKEDND